MNTDRRQQSLNVRAAAANLAAQRIRHIANDDECKFRLNKNGKSTPSYLASYTKGMPHDEYTGLVLNPDDFQQFVRAIDSGNPRDFRDTPLGPVGYTENDDQGQGWRSVGAVNAKVRAWESQGAGSTFDLEGPDAQAVTMPPAPIIGSAELTAEMAEVYAQALLRDVPFTQIVAGEGEVSFSHSGCTTHENKVPLQEIVGCLNELEWFQHADADKKLSASKLARKRGTFDGQTLFRGITPGDNVGPYLSQFLLAGNSGINGNDQERSSNAGLVSYGAISIDQRVRFAKPYDDHLTNWYEWLDVQEGADLRGRESYVAGPTRRFITTPRDLATYVHYDALYEAYLNACLIMLSEGIPFDPGIPFQGRDFLDHQQGFAHFGGPHILSLVTEVATRALKAVRFQKFNVHRRLRPEALAGRLARYEVLDTPELVSMAKDPALSKILGWVADKNGDQDRLLKDKNYLLPMAFNEGSPMHPSYGAGHATVAGACVTILKAFFDHKHPLAIAGNDQTAFVPTADGSKLETIGVVGGKLTVEGELNKLASNISIGRDWAGVHYFSDYIESLRMGEQIAMGILEEQKLTYGENFSMTVPLYDGGSVRI
ncbi:MAG: vanadium-dependent haloperoxidase [Limnothrix sp.]